jgi:hypothetical protein
MVSLTKKRIRRGMLPVLPAGADPCARCQSPGGKPHASHPDVPARWPGARYGIEGKICVKNRRGPR